MLRLTSDSQERSRTTAVGRPGKMHLLIMTSLVLAFSSGLGHSQTFPKSFDVPNSSLRVALHENSYEVQNQDARFNFAVRHDIQLKFRAFDPLLENIEAFVPAQLKSTLSPSTPAVQSSTARISYIVQFETQAFPGYQEEISSLGGDLLSHIPDNAMTVVMDPTVREQVELLPYVRWVGRFHPAYKLEAELQQPVLRRAPARTYCSILLHDKSHQNRVVTYIESINGVVRPNPSSSRLVALLDGDQLYLVANLNEVLFIDRATETSDDLDQIRQLTGANFVETVAGYSGQGVAGEIVDDGVRSSHQEFADNPLMIRGPSPNAGNADHGTNIAGILFASGIFRQARGLLPDAARPIFASRYQQGWPDGEPFAILRRAHIRRLVDPDGEFRAVFQTNSWGHAQTTEYTTISAEFDEILFDLDIVVTQSQSNEGNRDSRPEAWAKNIVSVGGIRGHNSLTRTDDSWSSGASIGPAADGRIKPDLSHFYGNIYSANDRSDSDYGNFGGTSGSTPVTAGIFGILHQMWADGVFDGGPGKNRDVFDSRPHMTTAKAILINQAYQYPFEGQLDDLTRVHQGWGFADIKNLYETARAYGWKFPLLIDESRSIAPLETHSYELMSDGRQSLKATLVYADPKGNPGANRQLVNNLSLKLTSPSGTEYWGNFELTLGNWSAPGGSSDKVNNTENVFVREPEAGLWTIAVIGEEIVQDGHVETATIDADYALVATGGYVDFAPLQYELETVSESGVIHSEPQSGTSWFFENATVTLEAEPDIGWEFDRWEGDVESTDNPITVVMDADKQMTARYTRLGSVVGIPEVMGSFTRTANRRANPFVMPEDGVISSLSMYHIGGSGRMILGVYDGAGSTPANLIGVTPVTNVSSRTGWQRIDLITPVHVAKDETIFLSWVYESNPGIFFGPGSPGRLDSGVPWSGGMPEQWGDVATQSDNVYSIYAVYNSPVTDIAADAPTGPEAFEMFNAYPNPFNPSTTIRYALPRKSEIELVVFDILGREVETIFAGVKEAGVHQVRFDANGLDSGVYFYRLRAGDVKLVKKVVLIR